MPTITAGSSITVTASVAGQTVIVSSNGGATWSASINGGAARNYGPLPERLAIGPMAFGGTVVITAILGDLVVEYGDASPSTFGDANFQPPVSGGSNSIRWQSGRLTAAFGDSLTNDVASNWLGAQEYLTHTIYASGGRMVFAGKFGQGGMGYFTVGNSGKTFEQAKADLLAASPRPEVVNVLLGTNDFGTSASSFAAVRDATIQFIMWLESNGFEAVPSQLMPRNDADATLRLKIHTFNTWVTRWAYKTKRRVNAWYSALSSLSGDGTWRSGYNRDSIHYNATGAAAAGAICAISNSSDYKWSPYLAYDNSDATGLGNPLFLTDATTSGSSAQTAGDGIPDNWGKANNPPAGVNSIVSASADGIHGNYMKITATTEGPGLGILRSVKIAAVPGDIVQLAFRIKAVVPTNGLGINVTSYQSQGTSWISANGNTLTSPVLIASSLANASQAFSFDTIVYTETAVAQSGTLGVSVDIAPFNYGGAGGSIYISQMSLRNITQLGCDVI